MSDILLLGELATIFSLSSVIIYKLFMGHETTRLSDDVKRKYELKRLMDERKLNVLNARNHMHNNKIPIAELNNNPDELINFYGNTGELINYFPNNPKGHDLRCFLGIQDKCKCACNGKYHGMANLI